MVFCLFLDTLRPCRRQQVPSDHVQVRQGEEHEGEVGVLRQAPVPDLRKAEDPFRDEEDVLSPASGFREQAVRFFFFFGELFVFRSTRPSRIKCAGRFFRDIFRLAHVGRVAEDGVFFPVKKIFHHLRVVDIGGGGDEAVDRPAFPVHSHVDLHAEIVLVSLLRGVHIGVPLPVPVLRGGGGVDDGSFRELQSLLIEVGVDFLKDPLAEAVSLEKMAKLADGGLVGDRFVSGVDPDEAPRRFHVVEGFFRPDPR